MVDPLADVRRLVDALRARAPDDPAARLLHAALAATEQLSQLEPAEAARRVAAAIRVLGALTPDPDTKSHVRPGAAAPGEAPPGARAAGADAEAPGTRARPRTDPARPRTDPARPRTDPARPRTDPARPRSDAHRAPASRGGRRPEPPLVAAGAPAPGTRGARRPTDAPAGRPPDAGVSAGVSDLARAWAELGRGALPSEPIELLGELVRAGVPDGAEAVRFHLALVRGLDHALQAARHLPCEAALAARAAPLVRAAVAGARALGVAVHPPPDDPGAAAPCPVHVLPAFGTATGALVHVEQHGFLMADGRSEPAVLRVASEPPPPWLDALLEGYAAVVAAAAVTPDGPAQARAFRAWLDELPGVADLDRRATTLRYAATAVFAAAEALPAAQGVFSRLSQALEEAGSYVIPLDPGALSDGRRYELVLRPGVGTPRVVRPGFLGPGQVVQQRARVLADPAWLGTMST
ncbi:MAG: hypothetical protein M9894_26810 [Planctomycetes bacterium]|nr:hypothetical protein [Planctomycetota bacterium]